MNNKELEEKIEELEENQMKLLESLPQIIKNIIIMQQEEINNLIKPNIPINYKEKYNISETKHTPLSPNKIKMYEELTEKKQILKEKYKDNSYLYKQERRKLNVKLRNKYLNNKENE